MYLTLFCFYVVLCVILLYSVTVFLLFMIPLLIPHVPLIAIQHSHVTMKPSLPKILILLILLCDVALGVQVEVFSEYNSDICTSPITTMAKCEEASATLGWGRTMYSTSTALGTSFPPGCFLYRYPDGVKRLRFNSNVSPKVCGRSGSYTYSCACFFICQLGTFPMYISRCNWSNIVQRLFSGYLSRSNWSVIMYRLSK